MKRREIFKITYSAVFLCLAMVLPFLTGQIKALSKILNPMHIAIFLCGLSCGAFYGAIVGFISPLLRSAIFGMPIMYPSAVGMAFELCVYGLVSGLLYNLLSQKRGGTHVAIIVAMIVGRLVWGIVTLILWSFMGETFTFALFIKGAFVDSAIGIAVQIIIIPIIIYALKRAGLFFNNPENKKE